MSSGIIEVARPFEHWVCQSIFSVQSIDWLLRASESLSDWQERRSDIYNFCSLSTPLDHKGMSAELLRQYQAGLSNSDQVRVSVDIFRFSEGQGIGFHDDSDLTVFRLAATISSTRNIDEGGCLLLAGSDPSSVIVYQATQNAGILFKTCKGHFHAVSVVSGAPLLLLVAQFVTAPTGLS
jgi:hypothetical protein